VTVSQRGRPGEFTACWWVDVVVFVAHGQMMRWCASGPRFPFPASARRLSLGDSEDTSIFFSSEINTIFFKIKFYFKKLK
jgi:hypothetical protein